MMFIRCSLILIRVHLLSEPRELSLEGNWSRENLQARDLSGVRPLCLRCSSDDSLAGQGLISRETLRLWCLSDVVPQVWSSVERIIWNLFQTDTDHVRICRQGIYQPWDPVLKISSDDSPAGQGLINSETLRLWCLSDDSPIISRGSSVQWETLRTT